MKQGLKVFLIVLNVFLLAILSLFLFAYFSSYPTTFFIRKLFSKTSYTTHENYEEISKNVIVEKNLSYNSNYKNSNFDLIYPKDKTNLPTILWIHGGAFVAGDKDDVLEYMVVLANEGYSIVNINYELAPSLKYPNNLNQISSLYKHLVNKNYPQINLDSLIIGGDSAGAHIAAQFINIQVNSNYSNLVNIKPVIPQNNILAAILFAGPYDFNNLANLVKNKDKSLANILFKFIARRIGYAYLGDFNWQNKNYDELTILNYVDENFPNTFITDGNTFSFEEDARKLENILISNNVYVKSVYYEDELMHEYQFNLGTYDEKNFNHALNTFNELVIFLNNLI